MNHVAAVPVGSPSIWVPIASISGWLLALVASIVVVALVRRGRATRGQDAFVRETVRSLLNAGSEQEIVAVVERATQRLDAGTEQGRREAVDLVSWVAEYTLGSLRSAELAATRRNALTSFVAQTSEVILVLDDDDRIRYASPSARALFGTSALLDRPVLDLVEPRGRDAAGFLLQHARTTPASGDGHPRADWEVIRAGGEDVSPANVEVSCRDLRSDTAVGGLILTLRDVTGQRRLEHELTRQVYWDQLTGLPNRASFHDHLARALAADVGVTGVILLDLDLFRAVNESLGRERGDSVLAAVARRLQEVAGPDAVTARLSGDEFAVVVAGAEDPADIELVAGRLMASFDRPVAAGGDLVACAASMGVATTLDATTEQELVRHADLALDAAKAAGRRGVRRYEPSMVEAVTFRLEVRSALQNAVADGSLVVEYQPIVSLTTSRTAGFEALVRWLHPSRGLVPPAQFIDIAEESDLITTIGDHVLASAITAARQWGDATDSDQPYVSVNVSARQFRRPGFVPRVQELLTAAALPPHRLTLEITESLLLRDDDETWEDLKLLRRGGVRIAIDDFGTGYSALGYLRQVPLDVVKLDRLFISTMTTSSRQRDLVRGIVGLVRTLGLDVVAEGIETTRQRDICAAIGCGYGQGFLFARSMSAPDVTTWLARERTAPRRSRAGPAAA